jgi:hypothetical protein
VIYGPGGIGKTKLASLISEVGVSPLFVDVEEGSRQLNIARVDPTPESFGEVLDVLRDNAIWSGYQAVVIDSLTKLEEMAVAWTLANVPHPDKGCLVSSVEGYGYGKGFGFVYDTFLLALQELDRHVRAGRHVVCIAHECTTAVPNPAGDDFLQYQPRLQAPGSGKSSIRARIIEWCDHLLYVGYDVAVTKQGKGQGSGSRAIYTSENPAWKAKSRSLDPNPIVYHDGDSTIWNQLIRK